MTTKRCEEQRLRLSSALLSMEDSVLKAAREAGLVPSAEGSDQEPGDSTLTANPSRQLI